MHFMIYALDKPNALDLRLKTREAHLEYVRGSGKMELAMPLLDEDENMKGSLIIIEAENREEAEEFSRNDPYKQAGLFESVVIERVKKP